MIIRAKAPLRLGLIGGGSDLEKYSLNYGGRVINATVNMYAYCTFILEDDFDGVEVCFPGEGLVEKYESGCSLPINTTSKLFCATYNKIIKSYAKGTISLKAIIYSDAMHGSGLGGSSAIVVAILKAFSELLNLGFDEYKIAELAVEIERHDLCLSGGKQDQYASAFGGVNLMEFTKNNHVIVKPIAIKNWILNEINASIVLFNTEISRSGSDVIVDQLNNIDLNINKLSKMKSLVNDFKKHLILGSIKEASDIINLAWKEKKRMSESVTNKEIDNLEKVAFESGSYAFKVSGAGGGGYVLFIFDPLEKHKLIQQLSKVKGSIREISIEPYGVQSWTIGQGQNYEK